VNIGTDLSRALRGSVLVPGDDGFDAARAPHNRAVDQAVAAVVEPQDAADVSVVVRYARRAGLTVAAQPRGHGASGDAADAILLRTGGLREVHVDAEHRVARVGAGTSWGDVLTCSGPHGLTGLAGSSPEVTVVGYTLGGGLSWFGRRFGMAANSVLAFDVVTADGDHDRVDAESDADLFWALRGGGGDFAIVTAIEFALHAAPELYGGRMLWPLTHLDAVVDAYRSTTADAPDDLTVWLGVLNLPDVPQLPEPLRGLAAVTVESAYLGAAGDAHGLLGRFERIGEPIIDTRRPMAIAELGAIADEPTTPAPALMRTELITSLDDAAAAALLDLTRARETIAPLVSAQLRHLGGALAAPAAEGGACGHLDEEFQLAMIGLPVTPEAGAAIHSRFDEVSAGLRPFTSGRKSFNSLGTSESAADAFAPEVIARLREIKRRVDPSGVFRSNYPVLGGSRPTGDRRAHMTT
jgi:FAD/FMN-containing dehydrogenase